MPADEATPTGQEPTSGGQAPTAPAVPATPPTTPASVEGQEPEAKFDADYVKKIRDEAANYRKQLRDAQATLTDLQAKFQSIEDAKLTEQQRLAKEAETYKAKYAEIEREKLDWERQRQELAVKTAIIQRSQALGIIDADAAYRLLDLAELEYDDAGTPTNLDKVLKDLLKARPYLVGGAAANPTNPQRSGESVPLTRQQRLATVYGGGQDIFDADWSKRMGGGVIWTKKPESTGG